MGKASISALLLGVLHIASSGWAADGKTETKLGLPPGTRLALIGDSITQEGGYARYVEAYLLACRPELKVSLANIGWVGATASGTARRKAEILSWFRPTLATLLFGMNDGGCRPFEQARCETHTAGLAEIMDYLKRDGTRIAVFSSSPVDTTTFDRYSKRGVSAAVYNQTLARFGESARQLAAARGAAFFDLYQPMCKEMSLAKAALGEDFPFCGGDGIHPSAAGHVAITYHFLKALGMDGDQGTIRISMKGPASAEGGHVVRSAQAGLVQLESRRYPFCLSVDGNELRNARKGLAAVPFNEELNRLTLVVTDLTSAAATVSWEGTSQTFSRAQLEKGINLMAEFAKTPFDEPFARLLKAVGKKQRYDIGLVRQGAGDTRAAQTASLANAGLGIDPQMKLLPQKQAELIEKLRELVQPLRHSLRLTGVDR